MKEYPHDTRYLISEEGKIFNKITNIFIKTRVKPDGYVTCVLGDKWKMLQRVVAETYIPNPEGKPEVNHIDGNKLNNHKDNLEWCTSLENKKHAWENGLYKHKGSEHYAARYSEDQMHRACQMLEAGYKNIEISEKLGIDKDDVSHLKRGAKWKHISCLYNLKPNKVRRKTTEEIKLICSFIQKGFNNKDIAEKFEDLNPSEVQRIRSRKTHKKISKNYIF